MSDAVLTYPTATRCRGCPGSVRWRAATRRVAAWVWNGSSGPPGSRHVHKQVPGRLPEGPWWAHDRAARVSVAMRVAQADV